MFRFPLSRRATFYNHHLSTLFTSRLALARNTTSSPHQRYKHGFIPSARLLPTNPDQRRWKLSALFRTSPKTCSITFRYSRLLHHQISSGFCQKDCLATKASLGFFSESDGNQFVTVITPRLCQIAAPGHSCGSAMTPVGFLAIQV